MKITTNEKGPMQVMSLMLSEVEALTLIRRLTDALQARAMGLIGILNAGSYTDYSDNSPKTVAIQLEDVK